LHAEARPHKRQRLVDSSKADFVVVDCHHTFAALDNIPSEVDENSRDGKPRTPPATPRRYRFFIKSLLDYY
jgi:hypothetical protein